MKWSREGCVCVCVCVCVSVSTRAHIHMPALLRSSVPFYLHHKATLWVGDKNYVKDTDEKFKSTHWQGTAPQPLGEMSRWMFFSCCYLVGFCLVVSRLCHRACRILVPRTGTEPMPPSVEVWGLNHWTSREFPQVPVFDHEVLCSQRSAALSVDLIHTPFNSPIEIVQFSGL